MAQVATPISTFLEANLAALGERQPEVASRVERATIPAGARPATGRDGRETFRIPDQRGRWRWMGHTSMPSISAPELFGNIRRDQGNVLLPGVFSGYEPLFVAQRLAPFCAVFVAERSAGQLKLAMGLQDYRVLIRGGRLVFFCGDDLADSMRRFFRTNPGYEYPGHLFRAPHLAPAENATLRERVEDAGQGVLGDQAILVERLQRAIADNMARSSAKRITGAAPRVALLSVDPSDASLAGAARVRKALSAEGWTFEVCIPDAPHRCHITARLVAIERVAPDFILFLNSTPTQSRVLLPDAMPVVSWYMPGFRPGDPGSGHVRPSDFFVASTAEQEKLFCEAGLRCFHTAPAADTSIFRPPEAKAPGGERDAPVAVVVDLPRDRAEDLGISLPSQVALWEALHGRSRAAVEYPDSPSEGDILAEAERKSGTTLSDDQLRGRFKTLIRMTLLPAAKARAAVTALGRTGRRVEIYGDGWEREGTPDGAHRGPIPDAETLAGVFRRTSVVVLPIPSDLAIQTALDALACGAYVLIGGRSSALCEQHPRLADAFPFVRTYAAGTQLIRALPAVDARRQMDAAALIREQHSTVCRLREVLARVQVITDSRERCRL